MAHKITRRAADKLEELQRKNDELAAENGLMRFDERAYKSTIEHLTIRADKAEAALAEAKRENEALREALEVLTANIVHAFPNIANLGPVKNAQQVLARNAGGNDAR